MSPIERQLIRGRLINAAANGGPAALWNIARGRGQLAQAAAEAIELATSPFNETSIEDAILMATAIEGGDNK